jgi:CBS domain containing-hemolysin-like protein
VNQFIQLLPRLGALGVLLGLSAFFSGAETSLFSLSRVQVKRMAEGNRFERTATRLLAHPQHLLSTILLGNMLVNVMIASLVASMASQLFAGSGIAIAIGMSTFLLLVFGEVTPKTFAVSHAAVVSQVVAVPLLFFGRLVTPIRIVLRWISNSFMHLFSSMGSVPWERMTREEIAAMLAVGEKIGVTDKRERALAEHILELETVDAHDIMVPRTEIKGLSDDLTLAEAFQQACRWRHARLPVYHEDLDDIWGLLSTADLPRWRHTDQMQRPLSEFREEMAAGLTPVAPIIVLSEYAKVEGILSNMRQRGTRFVVLADEYGGTGGVLTLQDVLNEIVGQISPGQTREKGNVVVKEDHILAQGHTPLRSLNRVMDPELSEENADTLNGYIMDHIGTLPRPGEVVVNSNYRFIVIHMAGRRIGSVRIEKLPPASGEDE